MTASPLESLAALDWAPTYQCLLHPCTGRAAHVVQRHALHACDDEGLTADGNVVELLCDGCWSRLLAVVALEVARLRTVPGRFACETCGAPVAVLGDVVRAETGL